MELLDIFYGTMDTCGQPAGNDFQAELTSWSSSDLASDAKILVWKVCPSTITKISLKNWLVFCCCPASDWWSSVFIFFLFFL